MFTGLIETTGLVTRAERRAGQMVLSVRPRRMEALPRHGDSVAVNGVCLTVRAVAGGVLRFDVGIDSLVKTTLGSITAGREVNLERALAACGRIEGHFVQGHVSAVGTILGRESINGCLRLSVRVPAQLVPDLAPEGSITVDGVSLTIANARAGDGGAVFGVCLVPHSLSMTTLSSLSPGDRVNVETDILLRSRRASVTLPDKPQGRIDDRMLAAWGYA